MKQVVIIGAGIIGGAIAYEMAKAGWAVTVVDKAPEAGYGSTSSSSAVIRINYSVMETCAMALEGWTYWRDWADYVDLPDERPLAVYKETGSLVIFSGEGTAMTKVTEIMDRIGGVYDRVAPEGIRNYLPKADLQSYAPAKRLDHPDFGEPNPEQVGGAVFFHQAGYVSDPKLAAQNLQWAAEREGAAFRFRTKVQGIETGNGRVSGVRLEDGTVLPADVVVNAAGPWSAGLNLMAGITGDMTIRNRPNRQEVAYIPGPANMDYRHDGIIIADLDAEFYARPDPVGICVGSTDPACDGHDWIEDPDALDTRFTDQWTTIVMRGAMRLPEMRIPGQASGLVALYDTSDDWLPIYDRTSLPGFYVACGTSGNQFKMAPVVGKLMTHLITESEAGHDHDAEAFSFQLERTGREINLGTYSRKRKINAESSFSVMG